MSRCVGRSTERFAHRALPVKPKRLVWAVVLHDSDRITGWHFILIYCDTWYIGINSSPCYTVLDCSVCLRPYSTFFLTYILQDTKDTPPPPLQNQHDLTVCDRTVDLFVWFDDSTVCNSHMDISLNPLPPPAAPNPLSVTPVNDGHADCALYFHCTTFLYILKEVGEGYLRVSSSTEIVPGCVLWFVLLLLS